MSTLPNQFTDALQILRDYHLALMTRIAEEIVDNRDDFGLPYAGRVEEIIARYGHHLQSLAIISGNLTSVMAQAGYAYQIEGGHISEPPGQPVGSDTALEVGSPVLVNWAGHWWPGQVVALQPGGDVLIHYVEWDATWDEVVPRGRLRIGADEQPEGGSS